MHQDYSESYTSALLRGRDITPRPPLAQAFARDYGGQNKKLLDIGCGTGEKGFSLADDYHTVVGLEPSQGLLKIARNNIVSQKLTRCHVVEGVADSLPFGNNQFDVAMSILSWWNAGEVHRVLGSHGIFIVECLGPDDKADFTACFGKDDQGKRGANLNTSLEAMKSHIAKKLGSFFGVIAIHNIVWQTVYTREGLWMLLNNTISTVRNFHPVNDRQAFDEAINKLQTSNGIVLTQNRLVVIANKLSG